MEEFFDATILKKLRTDKQEKMLIVNAPEGYLSLFQGNKPDTEYLATDIGKYGFVQVFGADRKVLEELMVQVMEAGRYDCLFWACYPKGGGKIKSDLKREVIWELFETIKLRPVSQVSLNETWSALRGRPHAVVGQRISNEL